MILQLLISAFGSCWGPSQATEGLLPVHYSLFLLRVGFLYSLLPLEEESRTDKLSCLKRAETRLTCLPLSRLVI